MTDRHVVVGAGPAGLACATVLAEAGRSVTVVDPGTLGGELLNAPEIHGFPGLEAGTTGPDLAARLCDDADAAGVEYEFDTVQRVSDRGGGWVVTGEMVELQADVVVLAMGTHVPVPAELADAERLLGRGVSVCAMCDGPLFRDRPVAVIGYDDIATSEAGLLSQYASGVTLVVPPGETVIRGGWRDRALESVTVEHAVPVALLGSDEVEALLVSTPGGAERDVPAAGVFLATGRAPASGPAVDLVDLAPDGGVATSPAMATSHARLFAVGDVRAASGRTVLAAISDGVLAARSVLAHPAR